MSFEDEPVLDSEKIVAIPFHYLEPLHVWLRVHAIAFDQETMKVCGHDVIQLYDNGKKIRIIVALATLGSEMYHEDLIEGGT